MIIKPDVLVKQFWQGYFIYLKILNIFLTWSTYGDIYFSTVETLGNQLSSHMTT